MASTVFFTVLSGTLVFVIGQIMMKFIIDPIHEQKRLIGEIADALVFYANVYLTTDCASLSSDERKRLQEAHQRYRQLASLLRSKTNIIPRYGFWEKLRLVKKRAEIESASTELIGLSNQVLQRHDPEMRLYDRRAKITGLLDLNIGE